MKECWPEGDLRAYLDRELAPEEMERATAHLAECPECSGRRDALAARAALVSEWMELVAEPGTAAGTRPRSRVQWKWVAAALAAAAAIVMAVVLAPHGAVRKLPLIQAPVIEATAPPVVAPVQEPAAPVHEAAVLPRPRPVARRPVERTETFVALDNEPFEAGWVVRMALGPDQIQADVVFSADGRARAYRLVSSSN